jgi:LemA protein
MKNQFLKFLRNWEGRIVIVEKLMGKLIQKMTVLFLASTVLLAGGCGVQSIPQAKNATDASLAEITNQYKRREDLIPNLVNTVKGYATHEQSTLEGVIEARAKATAITIDPSKVSPEKLKEYQQAQGQLSTALGRLMVVTENYPNLKADTSFRDLQAQLEGTENRIAVARQRYIQSINEFNNQVTVPPTSWTNSVFYHYEKMPQWDLDAGEKAQVQKAPEVKF